MRLRFRSIRLLPLLLAATTLLLGVKLFDLAGVLGGFIGDGLPITAARAEGGNPPVPAAEGAAPGAGKPQDDKPHDSRPPAVPAAVAVQAPPPGPSPQEIELLLQLTKRREALDARAQDIDRTADVLRAAEARLDQKLKEMKDLETVLRGLIKGHDEQQEAQMRSLVKIYENMKPKDAARIFEELEMATLLPVAERMNERKLAPVMAGMDPAKAKAITQELAQLRQLVSGGRSPKAG